MADGGTAPQSIEDIPAPTGDIGGGICRDEIDLRDRIYEPTLAQLRVHAPPDEHLIRSMLGQLDNQEESEPVLLPRSQGEEGTCGGQALAAVIDIQRILANTKPDENGLYSANMPPVSARMLHEMAISRSGRDRKSGVTLREVIKAFYNYGVCREQDWAYAPHGDDLQLTFDRARNAKRTSLGAYYRLRPSLNAYHAAINETGAILVSAELHANWRTETVTENDGVIKPPEDFSDSSSFEKHAFVIVGYTRSGFLVLNSWGREWGGWRPDENSDPIPGVALWRYKDWADRICDGWVLRLGVGAVEAFDYSVGDQGLGFGGETRVRSTPVHAILGHYMHTDDGHYAPTGRYPSDPDSIAETFRLLEVDAQKPRSDEDESEEQKKECRRYDGMLLTFAGGILGLADAAEQIARYRNISKSMRWWPLTALWCVDYVDQTRSVLDGVFKEAMERFGRQGQDLNHLIEQRAHGVGRALWRDVATAATNGARYRRRRRGGESTSGPFTDLTERICRLGEMSEGFRLRIITESEGVIALEAILKSLAGDSLRDPDRARARNTFFKMLDSIDIVAPPYCISQYETLDVLIANGWDDAKRPDQRTRLHLAKSAHEPRLEVPPYSDSYPDLVLRAFQTPTRVEDWDHRSLNVTRLKKKLPARTDIIPIEWEGKKPSSKGPITQRQLIYGSDVSGRIRDAITGKTQ